MKLFVLISAAVLVTFASPVPTGYGRSNGGLPTVTAVHGPSASQAISAGLRVSNAVLSAASATTSVSNGLRSGIGQGYASGPALPVIPPVPPPLPLCLDGEVRNTDGSCVTPQITRSVYVYAPPDLPPLPAGPPPTVPAPKIEHSVIFVRVPEVAEPPEPIVVPPPRRETVIYVLGKQSGGQAQEVIEVPAPPPSNPQVYFVDYDDGDNPLLPGGFDLQTALNAAISSSGQVIDGDDHGGINGLASTGVTGSFGGLGALGSGSVGGVGAISSASAVAIGAIGSGGAGDLGAIASASAGAIGSGSSGGISSYSTPNGGSIHIDSVEDVGGLVSDLGLGANGGTSGGFIASNALGNGGVSGAYGTPSTGSSFNGAAGGRTQISRLTPVGNSNGHLLPSLNGNSGALTSSYSRP